MHWARYNIGWSRGKWWRKGLVFEMRDQTSNTTSCSVRRAHTVELNILRHIVLLVESHLVFSRRSWRPVHTGRIAVGCARIMI
jgi:hypothetical protein